jgi:hypothetical protein
MDCEIYQENISRYIDNELDRAGEDDLFRHLASCEFCRVFIKDAMNLRSDLLSNKPVAVPEALNQRIIAEINSAPQKTHPIDLISNLLGENRIFSLRIIKLAVVLSVLVNVIFSILLFNSVVKKNQSIVCRFPLPEVEIVGYVITAEQQI